MKGIRVVLIIFLLGAAGSLWALQPGEFRFFSEVRGPFPANEGVHLPLGAQILSRIKADFSDIRLLDDRGLEIPTIVQEQSRPKKLPISFAFKILSYDTRGAWEEILLEKPKEVENFHEVELVTGASDFKKQVVVETSADGKKFEEVLSDMIFDFSSKVDLKKTLLKLPLTAMPYLRLRLKDQMSESEELHIKGEEKGSASFRIDGVQGVAGKEAPEETLWDHIRFENPNVTTDSYGNTLIPLGHVSLPVSKVSLEVENPYYYRAVQLHQADREAEKDYQYITEETIYKTAGMKEAQNSLSIPETDGPYLLLKVINENNPALKIKSVQLDWVRRNLYFIPEEGRSYTLYFGAEGMEAPSYELANILSTDPKTLTQYPVISSSPVQENPQYRLGTPASPTKKENWEKRIFPAVVFGVVVLLGVWGYSLMRKLPKKQ